MKVIDFANKYKLSRDGLYVSINDGRLPMAYKTHNGWELPEEYFIRRRNFKVDLINYNHDMYYLLTEYFSQSEVARAFKPDMESATVSWFSKGMFTPDEKTILNYRIYSYHWEFFRFARRVHRALNRRTGVKLDIGYLLDKIGERYEREENERRAREIRS